MARRQEHRRRGGVRRAVRDDAADFVRFRARNTLGVRDGMEWDDRDGAARALNIAATVLGL